MIKSVLLLSRKGIRKSLLLSPSLLLAFLISCGNGNNDQQASNNETNVEEIDVSESPKEEEKIKEDTAPDTTNESSTSVDNDLAQEEDNTEEIEENKETNTSTKLKEEGKTSTDNNKDNEIVSDPDVQNTPEEPEVIPQPEEVVVVKEEFSHKKFDALLRKYVTSTGKVDYNGFKSNASFNEYLTLLSENEPASDWSRNKKLAYWINAYNAFTIKLILDNYPVSSIKKLHGGKPWDYKFIKISSKTYSLNHIEHKIIRPVFKEPRIHFACVCAAKSCPKLANKAYTASNLNSLLTTQTKYFINNKSKNEIADKKLKVSSLFDWYASDFGDVNTYIAKYYNGTFKEDKDIEFMDYDWSLNN